jgi:glutamate/tyrosine decarboxylase-like PLP-dependent enzyme
MRRSAELHLGEISLECSRPGAAAVALWATQQLLPMTPGGEFAQSLDRCLLAARAMHDRLAGSAHFRPLHAPELDIVVYAAAAASGTASSERTRQIFEQAAAHDLHLAMIEMPSSFVAANWPDLTIDSDTVTCLRSCLMKPEHLDWVEEICDELERLAA